MFFFSFKFLRIIFEGLSLNFATKILFFRDIRKKNSIYFSKNLKKVYFLSKIQLNPQKPQPFSSTMSHLSNLIPIVAAMKN